MKSFAALGGLVYSTEGGRMCPNCRQPVAKCGCPTQPPPPVGDGTVRVLRETKGRGGKAVTVAKGVPLGADGLTALAKKLKNACGSGGTVKEHQIEIQGDHTDKVIALLQAEGFKVKRAGG